MDQKKLHPIPPSDPVDGGKLYISELTGETSGVTIRGRFEIPSYNRLDTEQARFLETFLRCRGMLSTMEGELGISYPTVRARLDTLLESLGLTPVKEVKKAAPKTSGAAKEILDQLERGEISAEEAKVRLKGEEK